MPNSTARPNARATKPRHQKARTTDHATKHWQHDRDNRRDGGRDERNNSRGHHRDAAGRTPRWGDERAEGRGNPRTARDGGTWQDRNDRGRRTGTPWRDDRNGSWNRDQPRTRGGSWNGDRNNSWRDDRSRDNRNWRDDRSSARDDRGSRGERNWRDERTSSRDERGGRDQRSGSRDFRGGRDDRTGARDFRDERGARGRDDRSGSRTDRSGSRDDRSGSRDERAWRGERSWRDDRGGARNDRSDARGSRDERGARGRNSWQRDQPGRERPTSQNTDRAERGYRRDEPAVAGSGEQAARSDSTAQWNGEIGESRPARKTTTFAELGLPTALLNALADAGISEPFPIQAATLPDALAGRDVLGRAQTGSGKTLAFGLALLTRLQKGSARARRPRGLVLVPTRELAMQVTDALLPLAKSLGLWCRTVVGGLSFSRQAEQLERGIDLLIATPGRLSDHVRQGTCVLDDVRFVALDEADQMADMGFLPQVREILDLVPEGQRMLFSATLDRDVAALVDAYLNDPVTHSVSPATASVSTMDHHLLLVSREDKPAVVTEMAARDGRTILFLRTKHHVDRLTRQLREAGVRAGALHGGKPQGARNRVLGEFKDGRLPVLVATDVAARGIHVDGVSLVVHVDPPADAKGYLHRAGRTARAGEAGTVVTVVTHQERRTVFRMTEQAGVRPERTKVGPGDADLVRITGAQVPSGEPVIDPEPTRRPGGRFNRPGRRPRR